MTTDSAGNAYIIGTTNSFDFPVGDSTPTFDGNGTVFVTKLNPVGSAIVYTAYLGGNQLDVGTCIAVDPAGNAYVGGYTQSPNFPIRNALQPVMSNPFQDMFLAKLDATGSALQFSTFFGGGIPTDIGIDPAGDIYMTGGGSTIPVTTSQFSGQVFLAKFNSTASVLLYSTKFGGSGLPSSGRLAIDGAGNVYITGGTMSAEFPTVNPLQPVLHGDGTLRDAFVSKFATDAGTEDLFEDNFNGENLGAAAQGYSAFTNWLVSGGDVDLQTNDTGLGVALNNGTLTSRSTFTLAPFRFITPASNSGVYRLEFSLAGSANGHGHVTAHLGAIYTETFSIAANAPPLKVVRDFAVTSATDVRIVFESTANPGVIVDDIRLSKVVQTPRLVYSTYLGGAGDDLGLGIGLDAEGNILIAGKTSSLDFPTHNAAQPALGGDYDAFAAKIDPTGATLVYSTYLGGSLDEENTSLAVDPAGNAHIAGYTSSTNFPIAHPFQARSNAPTEAFVTKLDPLGAFVYSTYLGGSVSDLAHAIAVDSNGVAVVVGHTDSNDWPTINALQPGNAGGTDAFVAKIVDSPSTQIVGVSPSAGGNAGSVTVRIVGANFPSGPVTVSLGGTSGPEIDAATATVVADTLVVATFDLKGAAAGVRDVIVTFAGAGTQTLPEAFTIEQGGVAHVWADIVGRSAIRLGVPTTIFVVVGNDGTVDALGVPVTISGLPTASADVRLDFDIAPYPGGVTDGLTASPPIVQIGDDSALPLFFARVSPGLPVVLPITFTARASAIINLRARVDAEYIESVAQGAKVVVADMSACANGVMALGAEAFGLLPGTHCAGAVGSILMDGILQASQTGTDFVASVERPGAVDDFVVHALFQLLANCSKDVPLTKVFQVGALVITAMNTTQACARLLGETSDPYPFTVVGSVDPNDKSGPVGKGPQRYISAAEPLRYAVYFENLATATAAARDVVITDRLEPDRLNLQSVSLGPIIVADHRVIPPPGLTDFSTEIDLRPATNLLAAVDVHLNRASGVLVWRMSTLDPATHAAPSDPLAGFLPPGAEGIVFFTAQSKTGLPTGTSIQNAATITFDVNAPISTQTWFNTLDSDKPVSRVAAIPTAHCTSIPVTWSGSDVGSGITSYTVFVSDDGAPPTVWQSHTSQTAATFAGEAGHTYAFYSVAHDAAGNVEDSPPFADAQIAVSDADPPVITLNGANPIAIDASQPFVDPGATALDACAGPVAVTKTGFVDVDVPGTFEIVYSAVDPSGNRQIAVRTINVIAPKAVKSDVLNRLGALQLDDAAKHLAKSIDDGLWLDASHPRPNGGESVFNEEKETVKRLIGITAAGDSINRLVRVDRFLAAAAIRDAMATGDAKKVADANGELSQGDADATLAKPDTAIEHYRKAWLKALDSMKNP